MEKIFNTSFFVLIFLLVSGLNSPLRAQAPDYSYNEFRFQGIDRQALELETGLGAWFLRTSSGTSIYNIFHSDLPRASYIRFRNLENKQVSERYGVGAFFGSGQLQDRFNNQETRMSFLQSSAQAYREYRYYYKPNRFFEYRLSGQAGFNHNRIDRTQNPNQMVGRSESGEFLGTVGVFTGRGRLEPIDDVFLAKFTLDGMQAAGLITDELSQEQVFSLGQHMARIRNQHAFNFRRQRSYELEQLDAWFREHTDIDPGSSAFLDVLKDNWLYGLQNTRFSGWRISVGLEPELSWQRLIRSGYGGNVHLNYVLGGIAEYHRPINQHWQLEHQASLGVNHLFYSSSVPGVDWYFEPFLRASTGLSWHPNTRTRISSRGVLNYNPLIDQESFSSTYLNRFISSLQLEGEYLLNYRMRASGFISLDNTFGFSKHFSMSGGVRFTYNIF
jgi:hypothetical protein